MSVKNRKGGRWCSVPTCKNNSNINKDISFFGFPKDELRAKNWSIQCRRLDLLQRDALYLSRNCHICSVHFEPSTFANFQRNRLKPDAVPTLFNTSKQASRERKPRRKRDNETYKMDEETKIDEQIHFEQNQFEQARKDGWKKLKPNAIPTFFPVTIPPKTSKRKSTNSQGAKSEDPAMPRCCSVAGCKPNYKSGGMPHISTCSLPRNEEVKKKWLIKIPTDSTGIKNHNVCMKHFTEDCIIRTEQFIVNNETKVFHRTIPMLKPGAVPSIFPPLSTHLSSTTAVPRRLYDAEQENLNRASASSLEDFKKEQEKNEIRTIEVIIKHFCVVKQGLKNSGCTYMSQYSQVVFCILSVVNIPSVVSSVCINENISVKIVVNGTKMPESRVPKQFKHINRMSVLEDFIYIGNFNNNEHLNTFLCVNEAADVLQTHCSQCAVQPVFAQVKLNRTLIRDWLKVPTVNM